MGDYSPHVLDRARQAVAHHAERVSALVVEATRPSVTLGFLAGKAFLVYISNVYDNLPTDELACIHGRTYQVETQAFLTEDDAGQIADRFGAAKDELAKLIDRLLRIGPELLSESSPGQFPDPGQAVAFWRATWEALRLRERYVPLEGLDRDRVLRPRQIRRVRGQLGERPAAPADREPPRVRGRVHAVPAAARLQHHHPHRPGQGLRDGEPWSR
jgi:hypothetical protein